ncbi:hypothetical protein PFISCL1PPCAC_11831, partial [Pristionchus fissidentatus]
VDLLRGLLYQFGFAFAFFIYQSRFKGNSLLTTVNEPTSYNSMNGSLHDGSRHVVLNSGDNYFTDEEAPLVLGSYSSADWCSDMLDCFRMVCNESSRVGLFYQPDIYGFYASIVADDCKLAQIALPPGQKTGVSWFTRSLQEGDSYPFVISKKHPRATIEKINFALLTVFTEYNMGTLLLNRNVPYPLVIAANRHREGARQQLQLQPAAIISLLQIKVPLQIL